MTKSQTCRSPLLLIGFFVWILTILSPGVFALPPGFQVYFNDAQHSSPNGIDVAAAEFIDSADETVAGAFYSIQRTRIVDALINAATRLGTQNVRIITDAGNRNSTGCQRLEAAGITVIDETCDGWSDAALESHHKFCVVDGIRVWTGSYNITDSDSVYNNNNALAIECSELAQEYLIEFNEMWGAASGPPGDCHFSSHKTAHDTHQFTCGGVELDLYFSPTKEAYPNRAMDVILQVMQNAQSSLFFDMFAFTSVSLANGLITADDRGLTVMGVMDNQQASYSSSQYDNLIAAGLDVKLDNEVTPHGNFLHHKFLVADYNASEPIVVTGSYNWSNAAQWNNDENSLIIHNADIAQLYYEEFYRSYFGKNPNISKPSIDIQCNQTSYSGGNFMRVWIDISNPDITRGLDEYIILDLGAGYGENQYYFYPDWTLNADFERIYLGADASIEQEIFNFILPYPLASGGPFTMWAAFIDPATGSLACDYDYIQFNFE